ncbi:MAG: DNA translocase FtsK 4TM domain-containing protein, partial [Pseudomonadota bacterium]
MTYSLGDNQDPDYTAPRGLRRYVTQLIGCVILAAGVGFMVLLGTYSPFDANWFAATGNPPENLLGGFGASVAGVLMLSIGWASWTIPVVLIAWGLRFLAMRGNETAFTRFIAIPFLLFVGATFAAVHTPPTGWPHDFGLGGLAGDATLDLLLAYLPADLRTNLVIVSLGLAGTSALLLLIATGVTFREVYWFFDMSIWSLGAVFNVLGRAFGGGSSTPKTPSKKTVRKEKAIKKRLEEEAPPKVTSDKQEIDPFESRISSDEIDEPILIDRSERQSDIISRVAERALAKPKAAKKGRTFVKPKGQASFKAGAGEGPKSGLKAMFKKPSPQTTMDIPENTEPARSTDQIVDPNESLEDRLKRKISDAIQERIQETEELSAAEEEQLREDVAIQVEEEMAEEEQLREDVAIQEEDDLVEEELEANVFAEAPEVIATSNGVPEPAPRRSLFERGENLFSSFGRARKARAEPLIREKAEPPVQADPSLMSEDRTNIIEYPKPKKQQQSRKAKKEEQPELFEESAEGFTLPPFSLLATPVKIDRASLSDDALAENAKLLETVLDDYGVKGEIVSVRPGPVVTMYELEPAPGLKASRVIGLADDIARSMSALSARVSTVPGRTVIGIELPNEQRETVYLREILSGRDYGDGKHALPLALGKDIGGSSIVADLAKMPHLLIAGTTGSGKSVAINTMILSLAYKLSPDECRMIMIDPKMLELSVYDGIPHLLSPVVTDPKKAVVALKWVVGEMEE